MTKVVISQTAITCSKLTIETLEQRCEICSKLTIKTPKRRQWRRFGVFIVNFEQVNAGWDIDQKVKVLFKLMVVLRINKQYAQHDISTRIPPLRVLSSPK